MEKSNVSIVPAPVLMPYLPFSSRSWTTRVITDYFQLVVVPDQHSSGSCHHFLGSSNLQEDLQRISSSFWTPSSAGGEERQGGKNSGLHSDSIILYILFKHWRRELNSRKLFSKPLTCVNPLLSGAQKVFSRPTSIDGSGHISDRTFYTSATVCGAEETHLAHILKYRFQSIDWNIIYNMAVLVLFLVDS